jgi:hypothetical protein
MTLGKGLCLAALANVATVIIIAGPGRRSIPTPVPVIDDQSRSRAYVMGRRTGTPMHTAAVLRLCYRQATTLRDATKVATPLR